MSFNVGDTVQLKSGGPDMTVTRIGVAGGEPLVWCAWFEGTKDAYGLFPPAALKASPEPQAKAAPESRLQAPPESRPSEVDKAAVTPEAVEAKQDPHPTQTDSESRAGKSEKSLEAQIASMQSYLSTWLKRP